MATKENLGVVLVESTLVVGDSRHVLDDNAVVGVLALLVENVVGLNHIVDNVGLGNLLGTELLLGAQVLAIVVAEMVVACNGGQLDTGIDEEVDQSRLHLGLARLEVIATNVGVVLLSKFNGTRNKGVLGRAIDERGVLQDTGDGKDRGGRNLLVALFDGLEQVVSSVVDAGNQVGVALGVGSPHDNNLIKAILLLELANVIAKVLDMSHGGLGALNDIVGAVLLVGSDEVRVVDGREGGHGGHLLLHLSLEGRLEDLSTVHGLGEVHAADIPATNDEVIGVNHRQNLVEGNVDILVGLCVSTKLESRCHDKGAVVVGLARALLGVPDHVAAVGNDTGGDSGTIVAAPADKHHASLGDLALRLEVVEGLGGSGDKLAIGTSLDLGSAVGVLGLDLRVRVGDIGGVDREDILSGSLDGGSGLSCPVRRARVFLRVGSHVDRELLLQRDLVW